jgi:hypothetical protein
LRRGEGLGVVPEAHFLHRGREVVEVVVRAEGELRSRDGGLAAFSRFRVCRSFAFFVGSEDIVNRRRFSVQTSVQNSRRGVSLARTSVVCERRENENATRVPSWVPAGFIAALRLDAPLLPRS